MDLESTPQSKNIMLKTLYYLTSLNFGVLLFSTPLLHKMRFGPI